METSIKLIEKCREENIYGPFQRNTFEDVVGHIHNTITPIGTPLLSPRGSLNNKDNSNAGTPLIDRKNLQKSLQKIALEKSRSIEDSSLESVIRDSLSKIEDIRSTLDQTLKSLADQKEASSNKPH